MKRGRTKSRWINFRRKNQKLQTDFSSWEGQNLLLGFHQLQVGGPDLIFKPQVFPGLQSGQLVEILPQDSITRPFVMQVQQKSQVHIGTISISISSSIANLLNLGSLRSLEVKVKKPQIRNYQLDWVLISIRQNDISRGQMWKITKNCQGLAVYKNQRTTVNGWKIQISDLLYGNKKQYTGVVTAQTKVNFKTKATRLMCLFQISKQMFEYTEEGYLYHQSAYAFLFTAFERMIKRNTNHQITLIFYMRLSQLIGNQYQNTDFYKTVFKTNDIRSTWIDALKVLKKQLMYIPILLNWKIKAPHSVKALYKRFKLEDCNFQESINPALLYCSNTAHSPLQPISQLSSSVNSNFLQSINYTINKFYPQQKVSISGGSIIVLSAGQATYRTNRQLAELTKHRVLRYGLNLNLISLKRKALHAVPMFLFNDSEGVFDQTEHSNPYWIRTHWFFGYSLLEGTLNLQSPLHTIDKQKPKHWKSLGNPVQERVSQTKRYPYFTPMRNPKTFTSQKLEAYFDSLDEAVFRFQQIPQFNFSLIELPFRQKSLYPNLYRFNRKPSAEPFQESPQYNMTRRYSMDLTKTSTIEGPVKSKSSSWKQRWALAFPVDLETPLEIFNDGYSLFSKSTLKLYQRIWLYLLEPQLLPLMTNFWPRTEEMGQTTPYMLWSLPGTSRGEAIQKILMHRLNYGFQLVSEGFDSYQQRISVPFQSCSLGKIYHIISPHLHDEDNIDFTIAVPEEEGALYLNDYREFDWESCRFVKKSQGFRFSTDWAWNDYDSNLLEEMVG